MISWNKKIWILLLLIISHPPIGICLMLLWMYNLLDVNAVSVFVSLLMIVYAGVALIMVLTEKKVVVRI